MTKLSFTVDEAREYAGVGSVEEWVHAFLTTIGDNQPLSDGLKLQERYWAGPLLMEAKYLKRCCGPEPDMEFVDSVEAWEAHILRFQELVQEGWNMPPLIAENHGSFLSVRDGNHRLEAMLREGITRCWVIVWDSESQQNLARWASLDLSR